MDSTQYHSRLPLLIANALLLDVSSLAWITAAAPGRSSRLPSPSPNLTEQTWELFLMRSLLKTLLQLLNNLLPLVYEVVLISAA